MGKDEHTFHSREYEDVKMLSILAVGTVKIKAMAIPNVGEDMAR
jgi:hypothetical protein